MMALSDWLTANSDDDEESRKKAVKPKPTVALIEQDEKPTLSELEPSSGPVEKKSRKNARSKKTSPYMATIVVPQDEKYRERLADPEEYRKFAQGTQEGSSLGLSAAYLHPINPPIPQESRRGGVHDEMYAPQHGTQTNVQIGAHQDESSQLSTFRKPGKSGFFPSR
jgi:hypothetical protein